MKLCRQHGKLLQKFGLESMSSPKENTNPRTPIRLPSITKLASNYYDIEVQYSLLQVMGEYLVHACCNIDPHT